jgi:hypothetical protein
MSLKLWPKCAVVIVIASVGLAGCGTTQGDRGLSGGLLGAGTGAAIGSLAGSAGEGALIGGLGGLAIGALTSPDVINLGEPVWHRTASSSTRHYASTSRTSGGASLSKARSRCTVKETATARITTCAKTRSS